MNPLHAQAVTLSYAGNSVALVPSLRAATYLERLHGGFPALLQRLQALDTATVRSIITSASNDQQEAKDFLAAIRDQPLSLIRDMVLAPAFGLIRALMTPVAKQGEAAKAPNGKPVKWADLYADLYQIATGWLGWPPATAWSATLIEITSAFEGHIAKLKAVHGAADTDKEPNTSPNEDQRQANIAAGLDPDFDRAALQALKDKIR